MHHVGITVTDVERSVAWYEEMLGMVQWMTETRDGGWTAGITRPGSDVFLGLDTRERNEGERFGPHARGSTTSAPPPRPGRSWTPGSISSAIRSGSVLG